MSWTIDDTERWLTDYPLPADFVWNGTRAYPRYNLKKGYGFWLKTAGPYHAALRGLFMLCHEILAGLPEGSPMPGPHELVALLQRYAGRQDSFPLSAFDAAPALPENPAENVPTFSPDPDAPTPAQEGDENPYG
jgi:hypothetical protein